MDMQRVDLEMSQPLKVPSSAFNHPLVTRKLIAICTTILALVSMSALHSPQARADIISTCENTAVVEGQEGVVNCTVVNLGDDPVVIEGAFAFAYPLAGDLSDAIASVEVLGPVPLCTDIDACPATLMFQVFFTTTPADPDDPHPDFGLNDVSFILFAEDFYTGQFVPGLYGSAAVAVYDVGLTPEIPTTLYPQVPILTPEDYDDSVDWANSARDRGVVTSTPEPEPIFMLGTGLVGLSVLIRARLHRGRNHG